MARNNDPIGTALSLFEQGMVAVQRVPGAYHLTIKIPDNALQLAGGVLSSIGFIHEQTKEAQAKERAEHERLERIADFERERAARRAQERRKGLKWAPLYRDLKTLHGDRYLALKELAEEVRHNVQYVEHVISQHNREAKARLKRLKQSIALRMAYAGHSNIEIARRLNVSATRAGQILKASRRHPLGEPT